MVINVPNPSTHVALRSLYSWGFSPTALGKGLHKDSQRILITRGMLTPGVRIMCDPV